MSMKTKYLSGAMENVVKQMNSGARDFTATMSKKVASARMHRASSVAHEAVEGIGVTANAGVVASDDIQDVAASIAGSKPGLFGFMKRHPVASTAIVMGSVWGATELTEDNDF